MRRVQVEIEEAVLVDRPVSKAAGRRAKMEVFNAGLEAEKTRIRALALPLLEQIELLHAGVFLTELAAAHTLLERREADPEGVMALMLAGLRHPHWKVRRTCADFMDHFGDQRCVEPLLSALRDPKEDVRRLALHSLCCQACKVCPLKGDFVPSLAEVAENDRSHRARRIATGTLGNFLHDPRAVATLRRLAEDTRDGVVAARARGALGRLEG